MIVRHGEAPKLNLAVAPCPPAERVDYRKVWYKFVHTLSYSVAVVKMPLRENDQSVTTSRLESLSGRVGLKLPREEKTRALNVVDRISVNVGRTRVSEGFRDRVAGTNNPRARLLDIEHIDIILIHPALERGDHIECLIIKEVVFKLVPFAVEIKATKEVR